MGANGTCYICYEPESQPPPIQSGCSCRDEAGFVHIDCMVQVAVLQVGHREDIALGWRSTLLFLQNKVLFQRA